ncbi:subtilisin-like protein [Lactarius psammicola]|nr:subtilisin-like protein [Lactarius psammicola]
MRYRWLYALSFLTAVPLADLATPLVPWDEIRVKHTWSTVPANWESLGHPPAGVTIDLYIALQPHRKSALVDALYKVSDPSDPRYGAHLSKEQVADLVRPHPDTLELVSSWLVHHGVRPSSILTTHGGAWLTVTDVPVSQANQLLGASYRLYRHAKTNNTIIRTVGYTLPSVLHTHIQAVAPTTDFAPTRKLRQTSRRHSVRTAAAQAQPEAASEKDVTVSLLSRDDDGDTKPSFLRRFYRTSGYVPASADKNSLGILGFLDEYPGQADLTNFMTKYRTDAIAATFTVEQVNGGGGDPRQPGGEANTDTQYTGAMVYPTPVIYYIAGGGAEWSDDGEPLPGDAYLEWFKYLLKKSKIPQTISISYSLAEKDRPPEYAIALCDLFLQLGARGVSVLFASGDDGVGAEDCKDDEGDVQFIPEFPASCPYVTSVGATSDVPEIAASYSGGGFSFYFPRPPYQNKAVPGYLDKIGNKHAGLYNPGGRGIPDISAQSLDFVVIINNKLLLGSGTSCSTPTVAGIISLLNDYRILTGKPPLGFLNPWLYSKGLPGLNDITFGDNPGCETEGFSATVGWDPVTGLGTPDFVRLQNNLP